MSQLVCLLSLAFCLVTGAQAQETRGIIPEEFVKARPAKGQASANSDRRTLYRRTSAKPVAAPSTGKFAQLGLTIWRLRSATAADTGARIIVHKENEDIELIPERLPVSASLHIGERIRLTFESPQAGYLYVIDREQFADGSFGDPVLIFPTTRTRNGDNQVTAGKLVEIPAQEDQPNYFTLQRSRLNHTSQTGEMLTVIVTANPLEGITIGPKALTLTSEQVEQWEQQWGARAETFDLAGGAGKTWTKAEQEAGANGTRQLTQEDPEPQTIYRVSVKPGAPLLVKVRLRYSRTKTVPRKIRR
jgi:hypothetical protein